MEEKTRSNSKDGRIPPQNLEAERSLLGSPLISDAALPEILTILKPEDFYNPANRAVFAGQGVFRGCPALRRGRAHRGPAL